MSRTIRAALAIACSVAALTAGATTAHASGDDSVRATAKDAREAAAKAAGKGSAEDAANKAAKAAREAANSARTASDAASDKGDTVRLQVASSGKCLGIDSASKDNGAAALQWTCNEGKAQQWRAIPTVDSSFVLRNEHSNRCLEVENSGTQAGANVQQWGCTGGGAQLRWRMVLVDPVNKLYQLRPMHTPDRCLDIDHGKKDDGIKAQQWYCNQTDAQLWRILPVA
ncbi:RICIN domain-containing protein [Streptomyces noursei]|uniref:RICIN domain-containing protein n=1 Tax=Streptomyces noursei TaxID=1971 RepID=UPI000C9BC81A|nr:RICIN domain-containing protein [Streptomyces noursei]